MRTWGSAYTRERPSESSVDRAMADAEQNGLGFHLRVRLPVLAVVAISLIAYYAPARSIPGLVVVAVITVVFELPAHAPDAAGAAAEDAGGLDRP